MLFALVSIGVATVAQQARTSPVDRDATLWMATPAAADQIARVEGSLTSVALSTGAPITLDLAGWMRAYNVPGISVAVFDDFRVVWAKTYGVKEAGKPEPAGGPTC